MSSKATNLNPEKPRPTVLIVDNEPAITDALAMILSLRGFRCSVAYNGWEGLRQAREVKPDMIISGVINGDGPHGIAMAIQILSEMPETKILLVSGQAATADLMEAAHADGHEFRVLAKPVHPEVLLHWCELGVLPDENCTCRSCRNLTDRD
jgi:DNA-binding NtrC family response regulator